MLPHKFVEILDAEQKKKEMQYVDYLHMIKLTDYHFAQQGFSKESFSGSLIQTDKTYNLFDPIKSSNPFGVGILSESLFTNQNRPAAFPKKCLFPNACTTTGRTTLRLTLTLRTRLRTHTRRPITAPTADTPAPTRTTGELRQRRAASGR